MVDSATHSERRAPDLAERIHKLEEDYERDPSTGVTELAAAYLADGRYHDALQLLERLPENRDFEQQILIAQAYFDTFCNNRAKEALKQAKTRGNLGDSLRAQLLLGELAFEDGRTEEAKSHLERVRELAPHNRRAAEMLRSLGKKVPIPRGEVTEPGLSASRIEGAPLETAARHLKHVGAGLAICVVLLTVYVWWAHRAHEAKVLLVQAQPLVETADVASLLAAEKKYQQALDIQGSSEHAICGLAETYTLLWVEHGMETYRAKAKEYVEKAVDDDIEKAARFAAEALYAYGEGRYEDAIRVAQSVADRGGVSEKLYYAVGLAQRAIGEHKAGRDNLRRAQDVNSRAPNFAAALGDAYDDDADSRNAAFFWSLAAKTNSSFVPGAARDLLARIRSGEQAGNLSLVFRQLEMTPDEYLGPTDRAAVQLARAVLLQRNGNTAESLAEADKAITATRATPRLLVARGRALLDQGQVDAGLNAYRSAYGESKGAIRYLYELTAAYIGQGKVDEALAALHEARGKLVDDPSYHATLGDAYAAKGDHERAQQAYAEANKRQKDFPEALLGLGRLAWKRKQYDEARKWFEKAVDASPTFPEVYEAVGLMWIEQRALGDADTQLQAAESMYKAQRASAQTMTSFYERVAKAYAAARGGSNYARQWTSREQALGSAL